MAGSALSAALFAAAGLMLCVIGGSPAHGDPLKSGPIDPAVIAPADRLSKAFTMVADHVKPAVVSVYSEKKVTLMQPGFSFPFGDDFPHPFFGGQVPPNADSPAYRGLQRGMGSGMILDQAGHILTNYHVVRDVDDIKVQLADKRTFEAEIVGTDPKTDVAVIKIKGDVPADLPTVTLGDSDALNVGSLVMAVGAPFGLAQTVTEGIISATGRSDVGLADYEDFLQTDAPINPGNSGGPLVNMHGEVIGMNSAIATEVDQFAGVGFAIPSNMIRAMLPRLIKGEKIVRGQLGVMIQDVTKGLARQFRLSEARGALIAEVSRDSSAQGAGIKVGDIILRYDGRRVDDVGQLRNLVAGTAPGTAVKIEILRDGKVQTLTATIGTQPEAGTPGAVTPGEGTDLLSKLGLGVQTLTPDIAGQLGVTVKSGAVITDVGEGSPASLADLQRGDVIVEADHRPIASAGDLERALTEAKNKDEVLLRIDRQDGSLFVVLPMK